MISADEFAELSDWNAPFSIWHMRNQVCDVTREIERLQKRVAELERARGDEENGHAVPE